MRWRVFMNRFRSTLRSFLIALLATALMAIVRRFVFIELFEFRPPVMPLLFAVTAAAAIGGLKSGLFATILGVGMLAYSSDEDVGDQLLSTSRQLRFIMFALIGGLTSCGLESLRSARQRIEDRQRELEREVGERRNTESKLVTEIHRREEAEMVLREREERTRLAVESAEIGTWDLNPLTEEVIASIRCKAAFGFPPEPEVNLAGYLERVHSEDRDAVQQAIQAALDPTGIGAFDIDFRAVSPGATTRWLIAKGQTFFDGATTRTTEGRRTTCEDDEEEGQNENEKKKN